MSGYETEEAGKGQVVSILYAIWSDENGIPK